MNIYDVAEKAGVSIATVSRVLNNKGTVSPATRARVERVLQQSGYTPSAIARGMVSKSLHTVAVLTVDIRVPHYARTAYTIERQFSRNGYEVILCNTGGALDATVHYLRAVRKKRVDGIVLVGSVFNQIGRAPEAAALLRGVPVVLANGALDLAGSYSVMVDDRRGTALAVRHLFDAGRRNLIYLKDMETASANAKCDGFAEGMSLCGLDAAGRVRRCPDTMEGGMQAAANLLAEEIAVDGIVCGEDLTAVGVVKGLQACGVDVPGQVAVTGYNASIYSRLCTPTLTTIDNKPEQVARLCVQVLEDLIEERGDCSSVTLLPELVPGGTG